MPVLRFDGSLWVNVDVALRNLDRVYGRVLARLVALDDAGQG